MFVYNENRVWIRITNYCNSNCVFCLDGDIQTRGGKISKESVLEKISKGYILGQKNKLIISGGEASTDENFLEYIKYAKSLGYEKIQTITNGIKWGNLDFCKSAVESGLDEITFSVHGHSPAVHDSLTRIQGSFENIIKGIYYFRNYFPQIIVNADIVVNKKNVETAYKIVQLLKKLGIDEFDILQIIPFGRAWDFRDELMFDDFEIARDGFQKIWKESESDGIHMRANRVFVDFLEGYESKIQNPEKIADEVANENLTQSKKAFDERKSFHCRADHRCKHCYLKQFCDKMENYFADLAQNKESFEKINNSYKIYSDRKISQIDYIYLESFEDFENMLKNQSQDQNKVVNIPFCLVNKNNYFTSFQNSQGNKEYLDFVDWFMDEGFRIKSSQCKECKFFDKCDGLHVNLIKKYGFKILNPIKND